MVVATSSDVVVKQIPIGDVKVRFRLRSPKEEKIKELADSISTLGLINPITVDNQNYLVAGFHRLHACQLLEYETVPVIQKDYSPVYSELGEIDENLKRTELNKIETAEHLVRREQLLEKLGVRMKRGGNQYSSGLVTTSQLAEQIGMSNRIYRLNRQPSQILPEVRDELRNTKFADVLMDMVKLAQQPPDIQRKVSKLLISGKCQTFQRAFVEASIQDYRKDNDYKVDFDLKGRWGIPNSIMRFTKSKVELQKLCDLVSKDPELEWTKREGIHFGTSRIPVYAMAADLAEFLITYYTPESGIVLDNFMGRGTNCLASLVHNRSFIGYDVHEGNVARIREVVGEYLPAAANRCELYHSDGVALEELKDKSDYLDAVVTDPPYVCHAERYSSDTRDISSLDHENYMKKIKQNFSELFRLIKTSNFEKKIFYPVIWKVGTGRRGKEGIVDMDYDFQRIAKECGFTLWDKLYNQLHSPWGAVNWERNYINRYVQKNYETNLVFVKF